MSSTTEHAACLACGCLCDDLSLVVDSGRVVEAHNACEKGRAHLHADRSARALRPEAVIDGRAASVSEGLDRAAELLARASSPMVMGLTFASIETQALAVGLADRLGGSIDPARSREALPRLLALQRAGRVSATLGEVKARADVVVFWGCDPVSSHPRHVGRYSVEPAGRFVPEGRAGRYVVVVDAGENATASMADEVVSIDDSAFLAAFSTLRALIRGARVDPSRVEPACGVSLARLSELADRLRSARYGALFFGDRLSLSAGGSGCVEAAFRLVDDLNESTRFVISSLGGAGNLSGAESVLAWQSGYGRATDFSRGFPQFLPHSADAESRLSQGLADTALIVAADPSTWLSERAGAHLARIPTIWIDPEATDPARRATVGLACREFGLESGGSAMRIDGVCLPIRSAVASSRRDAAELLQLVMDRLDSLGGHKP
jgi:formylmethanofuran dehydrogenase subunit B